MKNQNKIGRWISHLNPKFFIQQNHPIKINYKKRENFLRIAQCAYVIAFYYKGDKISA